MRTAEPDDVPGRHIVRIKQRLLTRPTPEEREPGVAGIVQNRPDGAALPAVAGPVPVLLRPPRRRTRDAVPVEPVRDPPIAPSVQVLTEQGEQWQHGEHRDQALISKASRQPGGVQRSTLPDPGDDLSE